jgi:uncharacterized protein YktA (UPF0223 family)
MVNARKKLATQRKAKTTPRGKISSDTVLNFFEDVSTAYEKGYVNEKLAEDSYSFYLCRWWEALKSDVDQERRCHKEDSTLFGNFERVAQKMRSLDEIIDNNELQLFLDDESKLVVD